MKVTEKARKLLGNREPHYLYGDIGLGSNESSVTHERMLEFIRSYPVVDVTIGSNSYGEFQFVSCKVIVYMDDGNPREECIQFWGNGRHEYRDVLLVKWEYNVGNSFLIKGKRAMPKADVIRQIEERRLAMGINSQSKQEKSGNEFEFVADLSDDDYALSNGY
jgi:dTDP-D-glucose 4,6-dehydratase